MFRKELKKVFWKKKKDCYFCGKKPLTTMTTLELNRQIKTQVRRIHDDSFSLQLLLNYAKRLSDNANTDKALTGNALRLWNRTTVLSRLYKGWDGAEANPIETKVIVNMQNVLKKGHDNDFADWVLFPDDNGTLLLQSQSKNASISLGNNLFSYVCQKGNDIIAGENVRFSVSSFLNALKSINNEG